MVWRHARGRFLDDLGAVAIAVPVVVASAVIVGLLLFVVWMSVARTDAGVATGRYFIGNYVSLFTDPLVARAAGNTFAFAGLAVAVAGAFGLPLAWLAERTDLPGRSAIAPALTLGLLLPGFFTAMGWIFLLHPRIGFVNQWLRQGLGLAEAPLPITNIPGMAWIEGLTMAPLFFFMTASGIRAMDPSSRGGRARSGRLHGVDPPAHHPAADDAGHRRGGDLHLHPVARHIRRAGRGRAREPHLHLQHAHLRKDQRGRRSARLRTAGGVRHGDAGAGIGAEPCLSAPPAPLAPISGGHRQGLPAAARCAREMGCRRVDFRRALYRAGAGAAAVAGAVVGAAPLLCAAVARGAPCAVVRDLRARAVAARVAGLAQLRDPRAGDAHPGADVQLRLFVGDPALAPAVARARRRDRVPAAGGSRHHLLARRGRAGAFRDAGFFAALRVGRDPGAGLLRELDQLRHAGRQRRAHPGPCRARGGGLCGGMRAARHGAADLVPLVSPALVSGWVWLALLAMRELTRAVILVTGDNVTLPVVTWSLWNGGQFNEACVVILTTIALFAPLLLLYFYLARNWAAPLEPQIDRGRP